MDFKVANKSSVRGKSSVFGKTTSTQRGTYRATMNTFFVRGFLFEICGRDGIVSL